MANRINEGLAPEHVSQPTLGKWVRDAVDELATSTLAVIRPDDVGLRAVCLLFRRKPAEALKLVQLLAQEPLVSRVEQWRGEMNVFAEVVALDSRTIDDFVERYEPDRLYEVVDRVDRLPNVLEHLGRQVAGHASAV
jgi:hypothetical protein